MKTSRDLIEPVTSSAVKSDFGTLTSRVEAALAPEGTNVAPGSPLLLVRCWQSSRNVNEPNRRVIGTSCAEAISPRRYPGRVGLACFLLVFSAC